jgi:nitronate monooxygenase
MSQQKWPDGKIRDLLGIEYPLIQAPMVGADSPELAAAVSEAGGLGSLACAMLSADQIRQSVEAFRKSTAKPLNLNFFCHEAPHPDAERERAWIKRLERYYAELGLDPAAIPAAPSRAPFSETLCALVEELGPGVVSFHFGLPEESLIERLKNAGIRILSSATSVNEAVWLEKRGCDAVIAQGYEAGGHRAMFLEADIATQTGLFALVPQIVDAVHVPVIASGGIGDARGIVAAFALGASAAQLGTAYLFCPEAKVSPLHLQALKAVRENRTVLTNVFSGRPARGILNRIVRDVGPMSDLAPAFPLAGNAIGPLRKGSEATGSIDLMQLWSGQSASLGRALPAGELTRALADEALKRF